MPEFAWRAAQSDGQLIEGRSQAAAADAVLRQLRERGLTPLKVENIAMHLTTSTYVGVPYSEDMIANAGADLAAQANPDADTAALLGRYPKAVTGDFDGDPATLSEMDALVAYLHTLK